MSSLMDGCLNIHDTQARAIKARYSQSKICHRPMHHFCPAESATTLDVKCTSLKYGDGAGKYEERPCSFESIHSVGLMHGLNPTARISRFFFFSLY